MAITVSSLTLFCSFTADFLSSSLSLTLSLGILEFIYENKQQEVDRRNNQIKDEEEFFVVVVTREWVRRDRNVNCLMGLREKFLRIKFMLLKA